MTYEKVTQKLDFLIRSYQNLIDNQVSEGEIVGPGVKGTWKADTPLIKSYQDMIEACSVAKLVIKQYQTLKRDFEAPNRWISVSDSLPEPCANVLFCDIDGDVMLGYYTSQTPKTHFVEKGSWDMVKNVMAWMPLPAPYREEQN